MAYFVAFYAVHQSHVPLRLVHFTSVYPQEFISGGGKPELAEWLHIVSHGNQMKNTNVFQLIKHSSIKAPNNGCTSFENGCRLLAWCCCFAPVFISGHFPPWRAHRLTASSQKLLSLHPHPIECITFSWVLKCNTVFLRRESSEHAALWNRDFAVSSREPLNVFLPF